jgi:serine/threonine protein kinase
MLYDRVHCEEVKIRKLNYGLVLMLKLDKEPSLAQCLPTLTPHEQVALAIALLELLQQLKEQRRIYCNIRPENVFHCGGRFVIINSEFLRSQGSRADMDSFMLETIENNWRYWPPEVTDPYSNEPFDFALDVYAVGCILCQATLGVYPFDSKLNATNNQHPKLDSTNIIARVAESCIAAPTTRRALNFKDIIARLQERDSELKASSESAEFPTVEKGQNAKKGANGILDNISTAFSKMMNDSEGWFLNYVEDDDRAPNEKYTDNILMKIYKNEEKADKLSTIMQKYTANNAQKTKSIVKILVLIWQIIRKGPSAALTSLLPNIRAINSKFASNPEI